jgi:RNA polymerase sigma factor (sigma-70 family)
MNELEALYKDVQPKIFAFFYVKTFNQSVAEDLTHDVFYEACKGIKSFAGNSSLQTWLFSIARNLLKKYYRSNKYKQNLEFMLANESFESPQSPEDIIIYSEETRNLVARIQALDDLLQEIVTLRIYGDLSFKEIGQLVQKSENYVRVTFHRAKLTLQKEMGRNDD